MMKGPHDGIRARNPPDGYHALINDVFDIHGIDRRLHPGELESSLHRITETYSNRLIHRLLAGQREPRHKGDCETIQRVASTLQENPSRPSYMNSRTYNY
jgi:hypothetical protein